MAPGGTPAAVTLHRFYLTPAVTHQQPIRFPAESARQIRQVLRLRTGDHVEVFDGSGYDFEVTLTVAGSEVTGLTLSRRRNVAEPQTTVTLYPALIKGAKFELVLQKCTEIGIARMVPTITARAVVRETGTLRNHRFAAIIREAAEQSGRGCLPTLAEPLPLSIALEQATAGGATFLLWEQEKTTRLENVPLLAGAPLSLFIGPEGGFTADEAELAVAAGARPVTLGPRVLRAETAAIVGTALILSRLEAR